MTNFSAEQIRQGNWRANGYMSGDSDIGVNPLFDVLAQNRVADLPTIDQGPSPNSKRDPDIYRSALREFGNMDHGFNPWLNEFWPIEPGSQPVEAPSTHNQ